MRRVASLKGRPATGHLRGMLRVWIVILWGAMLFGWSGCAVPRSTREAVAPPVHLFLLAGQSNMAGRGVITAHRQEPIERVMALQQDGSWGPALDPLHWDKGVAGVGLARSFARAYQQNHPGVIVGFVPAACGGSPLEMWEPGAYFAATKSYPYDDAIARTRHAVELSGGTLVGVLWHQGEADSRPERAGSYRKGLESLIARFRRDLGNTRLPFVLGQLGRFAGKEWDESRVQVDAAHQAIAASDPNIAFADAEGLTSNPDMVHFDAESLDEFGRRYARAWAEVE